MSTRPTPTEAAETMSRFCNIMGLEVDEFVAEMSCKHRTLQQSFTGLCMAWLEHLAALEESQYDMRNAKSVQLAQAIVERVDTFERHLPCI